MSSSTCIVLAALAGVIISFGYNVIAYAKHVARRRNTTLSGTCERFLQLANLVLSLTGIGIFVISSKFGPVSVAMPVQTASNLLLNMIIQSSAGMKEYTKSMRIGTLVLTAASVCLMNVGPTDPEGGVDVLALVGEAVARVWLILMVALLLASVFCLKQVGGEGTRGMLGYAFLVADSTALGATAGKMITATTGWLRASCLLGYLLMGVGSLFGGLAAAGSCDIAVYLPTSQCIQLVINGLTGLFVWGDAERIQAPLSYLMVFILLIMGVYLCSELDVVELYKQRQSARNPLMGARGATVVAVESNNQDGTP